MQLARHTDVKLTMRYTHIGIEDQASALQSLPRPTPDDDPSALQMRCISGGFGCHFLAPAVTGGGQKESRKSFGRKTYGVDCPELSDPDQVEAAGIEPASRGVSVKASTCVVGTLNFAEPPHPDVVRTRLDKNGF
jgi:hypothetical protein